MAGRDQRGLAGAGRCAFAAIALTCVNVGAAPADPEKGLPLVNTILPLRYNTPASPVGPQAFALTALRDGSILVANNAGLLRLSGTQASAWNPLHGNVLTLARADDDTVYVGGVGEIGYFTEFGGKFESLSAWAPRLGLTFGDFWISVAARGGGAYFADATHVLYWDGRDLRLVYTGQPELLQGGALGNGAVVLDPSAGLVVINRDTAHLVPDSARVARAGSCALATAGDAAISVCADGVSRWRADGEVGELPVAAPVRELLKTAGITTARIGEAGDLLIGTRRAGVLWLDANGALSGHLAVPEWGESRVFSLLPRHDDGFWVGLDYGVAHVEAPGQLARYDALLGLPRAIIATIRVDGELFAVTTRGVYRLEPAGADAAFARFELYAPTQTTLFAVAQSAHTLFIASGEGVYAIESGRSTRLDSELAYSVFPLDDGGNSVLAGGLSGVRLLRKTGGQWHARAVPGIDTEIRHFQPDRDGAIWLTGNYTGVHRLHPAPDLDTPARVEHFGTAQGLPNGRVIPLALPDGIVFNAADGLRRFDAVSQRFVIDAPLMTLLPVAQGETRSAAVIDGNNVLVVQHDRVRLLEHADRGGAWHEVFTPLARLPRGMDFRHVRVDADGSVWIAANEALFRHRPATQATLAELPRPQIRIDGADDQRDGSGALQLGVAPRNVRARFEEGFFDGVEQLRFRTRLEPLESAWSDWQQSAEREMTHLFGGKFTLVVQARDIFGRDSQTSSIVFALIPPWYLRWWAFALAGLAFVLLLAWLIRRRDRALRRRAAQLSELVRVRTQELEQASITDALTGLRNRHYVQLTGTPWHHGESAYWLTALVDIDHFKRINDERGHAVGDEVLRAVAGRLSGALPTGAVTVRWGGEEFLVIVAIDDSAVAAQLVRRLLHAVGDSVVMASSPPPLAVTCSIGWDVIALDTTASLDMVLSRADHRLYAAKRSGRDRACGTDGSILMREEK